MNWLNYHHLLYFWMVAKEGSIVNACEKLHLTQPTVSVQLQTFEKSVGHQLFKKVGRNLVLTEVGKTVFHYADDIFKMGMDLQAVLANHRPQHRLSLKVGITDSLPKIITFRILDFLRSMDQDIHLRCYEDDDLDGLLLRLSHFKLDLVLADSPAPSTSKIKAYNHLLGSSACSFFGVEDLQQSCLGDFPQSLHQKPFLLPSENTALRGQMDRWFEQHDIQPHIVAEFDDMALLKVFGEEGVGIFCLPSVVKEDIERKYQVKAIGEDVDLNAQFYAISIERKIKHPALVHLTQMARQQLFKTRL